MSTGSAASPEDKGAKLPEFTSIQEAVETGHYVEELLEAERQWITNRLAWLVTCYVHNAGTAPGGAVDGAYLSLAS